MNRVRKALVAVAGLVANVVALNFLPANAQAWAVALLSALTALGVYQVPNK